MDDLPEELLEDVLRRLSPRDLAVCRSVHKDWRAAVDTHGLLLVGPVRGVFVNYMSKRRHGFFSRVSPAQGSPAIDGRLRFLPVRRFATTTYRGVLDHRNGLLLYENTLEAYVCNPATQRWATLPPPPVPPIWHRLPFFYRRRLYLLFDPTISLHYDVLFLPDAPEKPKPPYHVGGGNESDYEHEYNTTGPMEWPPYSYQVQVFSSRTGQWEDKNFVREGDAAVKVFDVWSDPTPRTSGMESIRRHGVYWRGALYVHCCGDFVMRLSLQEEKYRVIKTPRLHVTEYNEDHRNIKTYGYLGRSSGGVYYSAIHGYQFQVWILREASESHRTPKWEVKHQANLKPTFVRHYNRHNIGTNSTKSWILNPSDKVLKDGEDHEWDSSDDDSVVDTEGQEINSLEGYNKHFQYYGMDLLGYHPYKEIAFLGNSYNGFAYYLDSSKLHYLGSLLPRFSLSRPASAPIFESFIYTPCTNDLLPAHHDM